jgi:hypothetical protein
VQESKRAKEQGTREQESKRESVRAREKARKRQLGRLIDCVCERVRETERETDRQREREKEREFFPYRHLLLHFVAFQQQKVTNLRIECCKKTIIKLGNFSLLTNQVTDLNNFNSLRRSREH